MKGDADPLEKSTKVPEPDDLPVVIEAPTLEVEPGFTRHDPLLSQYPSVSGLTAALWVPNMVADGPSDPAVPATNLTILIRGGRNTGNQSVLQALVIAFEMIMLDEGHNGSSKLALTEENHSSQTLSFDRKHKSFRMWIQIWRAWWQTHRLYASRGEDVSELLGEQRISVVDKVTLAQEKAVKRVCEIACNLFHPFAARIVHDASNVNTSCGELHHEEHVVTYETHGAPDFDCKEISCGQHLPMSAKEFLPRRAALGCWLDAVTC